MKKKQTEKTEKTEEVVVDKAAENEKWLQQLTNKNEDYIFQLKKRMTENQISEVQQTEILYDMLSEIVYMQKKGQTAKQLYGTPISYADQIGRKDIAKANQTTSPNWQVALDGGLLFFALLAAVTGVTGMLSKKVQTQQGVISLIFTSVLMGVFVVLMNNVMRQPKKGKGIFKSVLLMVGIMLFMMLVFAMTAFIPETINVALPNEGYLILAAVALAIKIYLKRKLKITGGIF